MWVLMEQDGAVWAETTDGGLLKQLFGFYPTLHDARILEVEIDRNSDSLTITVDYCDNVGEDRTQELSARIRLEWHGIITFDLPLGELELLSIDFKRHNQYIETNLETWPGVHGTVVSDSFEAVLVQVSPGDPDERAWIRYK